MEALSEIVEDQGVGRVSFQVVIPEVLICVERVIKILLVSGGPVEILEAHCEPCQGHVLHAVGFSNCCAPQELQIEFVRFVELALVAQPPIAI